MTTDEQLAAIRDRHAKMPAGDYTKREPHDDWGLVRRPDGWPFADVAMSIDSSTQAWGGPAPEFVEAKREFVANAVADIAFLLSRIDELTAERDEAEANIGEVNQLLADTLSRTKSAEQQVERLTAELAAAKARAADQIKSANLVEVVLEKTDPAKWAAMQIVKGGRPDMTAAEAVDMIESVVRSAIKSAHAIERGEHEPKQD